MCGIVGAVKIGEAEPYRSAVKRALRKMTHRGPDGEGLKEFVIAKSAERSDEHVTVLMGHRRLAIIDLSEAAAQPMSTSDGRFHLVFNGEIYNYRELRTELVSLGHVFHTRSDTEVLLVGWRQWRTDLLPRLIGMFSFAVFDRESGVLVLARDPFGIKPLHYLQSAGRLIFASTITALLDFPGIGRDADPEVLYEFLSGGMGDHSNKTFFRDIHQLPAAHYMSIVCQSPQIEEPVSYWRPKAGPSISISANEASSRFRELFEESIQFHLRSDVPVAISLSGGLDSSAIAAMIRSVQGPEASLQTFSYVADDARLSEERWCAIVARATSAKQHLVRVRPSELVEDFHQLVRVQEQPFGSPTIYAQYRIYRCAHEAGMKVVLSGQGSDQYLGYTRHVSVRLASLVRSGHWLAALRFLHHTMRLQTHGALSLRSVIRQILPGPVSAAAQLLRRTVPDVNTEWFQLRGLDLWSTGNSNGYRRLHELLKRNLLETVPSLLRFEDRNAMAFSVENRVPFLTTRLVDFVLSLPEEEIISEQGECKAVMLRAMRGVVPTEICERRDKIGFAMPIANLYREAETWLRGSLQGAADVPALNASEVQRRLPLILMHPSDTAAQRLLWRWLSLVAWAREFNVSFE